MWYFFNQIEITRDNRVIYRLIRVNYRIKFGCEGCFDAFCLAVNLAEYCLKVRSWVSFGCFHQTIVGTFPFDRAFLDSIKPIECSLKDAVGRNVAVLEALTKEGVSVKVARP